jgi:glycosyltransferase involved in cell wall biosynthesis
MRIAQVAPLFEAVPPKFYGGTERIVSYLTEELVERGHEVTLFASGDSSTRAILVPGRDIALRLDPDPLVLPTAAHLSMLDEVRKRRDQFDVIHVHIGDLLHFPFFEDCPEKVLTTVHNRLDFRDLQHVVARWPGFGFSSISLRQRQPLPAANWLANIYHGLPFDLYPAAAHREPEGEPYVAFLGRASKEKGPDRAIEIARRCAMKLKIAAKIGFEDQAYYDRDLRPLIDGKQIEFIGEVDDQGKAELLGGATALLLPIDWPEPFGLVVIEAMAFGVPVIVWNHGSMPEIVDDGITGFIVDSVGAAVARVAEAARLDRQRIRYVFERRFSAARMTDDYVELYRSMTAPKPAVPATMGLPDPHRPIELASAWRTNGGRHATGA